jgi:Coenzyme PQQ synthesis protein D (PqqD)
VAGLLDVRPLRHPDVEWHEAGGEVVLVAAGAEQDLNEVGSRIWTLADGTRTVREIAGRIVAEFEVDAQTAERDAAEFVETLLRDGLLVHSPDGVTV